MRFKIEMVIEVDRAENVTPESLLAAIQEHYEGDFEHAGLFAVTDAFESEEQHTVVLETQIKEME